MDFYSLRLSLLLWLRSWKVFIRALSMICGWREALVFVSRVISIRLQSFIIKNINLFLFHVEVFFFFCLINKSFNVYIIVFYSFTRVFNAREISPLFFARFFRFHYAQEKSYVSSHIFNNFIAANLLKSLNPLKKNGRDLSVEAEETFSSSSPFHFIPLTTSQS